ncbi:MAG: hypothetical protein IH796_04930, partial [Deltaproteobacteria bacterium]|nr:hypothetical protein [Deltaproteobacteria bacterium]
GATIALDLRLAGAVVATGTGSVIDAGLRTVGLAFTDTVTGGLADLGRHELDVKVTTSGGKIFPLPLERSAIQVKDVG